MAKSQSQLNKEHIARIRRKAKVLDIVMVDIKALERVFSADMPSIAETLRQVREEAEKAVQE